LTVIVIEKSDRYGGTSAVSGGGIWVPNNLDIQDEDTPEKALTYLRECTQGTASEAQLISYIEAAPRMASYLTEKVGIGLSSIRPLPDYLSRLPGAVRGRAMAPADMDGKTLGEDYFKLREPYSYLQLFGKVSINNLEAGMISAKAPGWRKLMLRLLSQYWLDVAWRRRTRRDRRLCNGQALIGGLRKAMQQRDVPILLNTGLDELIVNTAGRVTGIHATRNGKRISLNASRGVLLAAGGFESNQTMREQYLGKSSAAQSSAAPRDMNVGDAIRAGAAAGGRLEFMNLLWKAPVLRRAVTSESNVDFVQPFFWDRAAPGSICVNRLGDRFVDEAVSYDEFGAAMLADHQRTGANLPCWMIFDADCRKRSLIGPLLPGELKPDNKLQPEWLDSVFYRADSIEELGRKIDIAPASLVNTIGAFNCSAISGIDEHFDRGGSTYDQFWANPSVKPNGSLAPLKTSPYYAVMLDLGDIGTKGGLAIDTKGRVMGKEGPVSGLYAAGNSSAAIFANAYPGAGGTLGPAMTVAMLAIDDIAATT
jgi:3-oxosteroid 1-dehydrogenase